jgi:predicted DNA-binding transcriptional regulator AlpA
MAVKTLDDDKLTHAVPASPVLPEFVTASEFASILKISKRTLFRLRARGDLPAPVEIATNIVRWRSSDVNAYVAGLKTRKPRRTR